MVYILNSACPSLHMNASGFRRCTETSTSGCGERDRHPESYCITIEEDPFCDDINICDDSGHRITTILICYSCKNMAVHILKIINEKHR